MNSARDLDDDLRAAFLLRRAYVALRADVDESIDALTSQIMNYPATPTSRDPKG